MPQDQQIKSTDQSAQSASDQTQDNSTDHQPTELEKQLEEAKTNPDALMKLALDIHNELKSTRSESASRRQKLKELEEYKTKSEEAAEQAKLAEMSELERIKAEKTKSDEQLQALLAENDLLKSRDAFRDSGATDIDTVSLYWKTLDAEEKKKTTPTEFAESLKKTKPHLFGAVIDQQKNTGPPPGHVDKQTGKRDEPIPLHPKDNKQRDVIKTAWQAFKIQG